MSDFLTAQFPVAVLQVVQQALTSGQLILPGSVLTPVAGSDANAPIVGYGGDFKNALPATPLPAVIIPSGYAPGDLLLAFVGGITDAASITANPPTGWVQLATVAFNPSATLTLFAHAATGNESDPINALAPPFNTHQFVQFPFTLGAGGTLAAALAAMVAIRGADFNRMLDAIASSAANNENSHTIPSVTTSSNGDLILCCYMQLGGSHNWTPVAPLAYLGGVQGFIARDAGNFLSTGIFNLGTQTTHGATGTQLINGVSFSQQHLSMQLGIPLRGVA